MEREMPIFAELITNEGIRLRSFLRRCCCPSVAGVDFPLEQLREGEIRGYRECRHGAVLASSLMISMVGVLFGRLSRP